jgi:catechol 2,3-dioxygenase-like lactoylglutathione lyase family enzyme
MKLGYTIIYVPDVSASLEFFSRAFGIQQRFLHESGTYGELETGQTTLAFAAHELGARISWRPCRSARSPSHWDLKSRWSRRMSSRLSERAERRRHRDGRSDGQAWGQMVSYLRCPDGCVVELCTPMAG